jgi:hypothetical protein
MRRGASEAEVIYLLHKLILKNLVKETFAARKR